MTVHVLVPGASSVLDGHNLLERIEKDLRRACPNLVVVTHLEPLEDQASFVHETLGAETEAVEEITDTGHIPESAPRPPGRLRIGAGMTLLLLGGAGSMVLPEIYVDAALGVSLLGLLLSLDGHRRLHRVPIS